MNQNDMAKHTQVEYVTVCTYDLNTSERYRMEGSMISAIDTLNK